jgi:hypothetical protein
MATVVEEARYKALQGLERRILEADSAESVEEVAVALRTWFESLPETVQTQANRAIELRMGEHEELSGSPEQAV